MGCISSKNTVTVTPAAFDSSWSLRDQGGILSSSLRNSSKLIDSNRSRGEGTHGESQESGKWSSNGTRSLSFRLGNLHSYIEGEQVAAGWPAWLSAVAAEAIQGWIPLKAESFEKLEKIGQGTYSSVFRARDLETGKVVALKKVRFDNFDQESVRFMAREIQILRRLDHPNIVKLEGLITSRISCSLYLVFEYMEHDLAGLSSCPDICLSEAQVKCYMHQLLSGLEHCHSRGIMHRDIKCSNLLVNNEGILKIADFGLANFFSPGQGQPLTSRVVTLWYRPPELLLGSTDYVSSIDLWTVGCVFGELLLGKPILQGRTEVEQLHKIFKLCGSPPEEYWKKSNLPNATIFKPKHPYESSLRETYSDLPPCSMDLLETFLSVEPYKRGTASSSLKSQYFATKPFACEPSSLFKYPPNKEIDAKTREESRRKGLASRGHGSAATHRSSRVFRPARDPNRMGRVAIRPAELQTNNINPVENNSMKLSGSSKDGKSRFFVDLQPMPEMNPTEGPFYTKHRSPGEVPFSGPLPITASSGFAWAKKRREDSASSRSRSGLTGLTSDISDSPSVLHSSSSFAPQGQENGAINDEQTFSKSKESYKISKQALLRQWAQLGPPDSFDASNMSQSQDFSETFYLRDGIPSSKSLVGLLDQGDDKVEFSGPLLCQSRKFDELLEKHERHIRQAMRRSWFRRGWKHRK